VTPTRSASAACDSPVLWRARASSGPTSEGGSCLTDPQQLLEMGQYRLLDGPAAADELVRQIQSGPVVWFSWTLFPGEALDQAAERLDYFARAVIPVVRERVATSPASEDASASRAPTEGHSR
jgi:hypothetical protein